MQDKSQVYRLLNLTLEPTAQCQSWAQKINGYWRKQRMTFEMLLNQPFHVLTVYAKCRKKFMAPVGICTKSDVDNADGTLVYVCVWCDRSCDKTKQQYGEEHDYMII
mmetsp:Transcript_35212/g.72097  ORF Transcript_35212/g.72097 Transcript_35212/m.72097 type:complete len:107 (+) Transcript_35212:912-1232(+)